MKLLNEAIARTMIRLNDIEHEARTLFYELDTLEVRLRRAFEAVSIDGLVVYLGIERKRMLEDEKRTKTGASLAGFPALGILALISLFRGQRPNWDTLIPAAFSEEPFEDVRIAVSEDNIRLVNVSQMARERGMTIMNVVAYLRQKGNEVLNWQEFEARAKNLRVAALKGELTFPDKEEPLKLQVKSHEPPRLVSRVTR
jgi:hypothetical protein